MIALALATAALTLGGAGTAARTAKVEVADNFYAPAKLTVKRRTRVTWRWPEVAGDVHDVKLKSGPKGVRKFHSEPASSGYRFRRKLRRPGRYRIVCTLHEEMTMTVRVRKR